MEETVKQEPQNERTFTQEEVNNMISERVGRLNAKYADFETYKEKAEKFDAAEEASKSELQKATERADALQSQLDAMNKANTVREIRDKVATATGVPAHLLTADSEEACQAQASAILKFKTESLYPTVADGGDKIAPSGGTVKDQFVDWFNSL